MKGKKFEKKVDSADEAALNTMYLERMNYDPSAKDVEEMRVLSELIPENVKDDLQYAYYERRLAKLNKERFRILTGYGQCRESLIAYRGDVIVCCCREMASLVAFHNAYYFGGKIHVPGERSGATRHEDSVYIINEGEGQSFSECPYCLTPVLEKIDFDSDEAGPSEE